MLNRSLDKQELLRIVDSVANEKSIDKELILTSMEVAIQRAAHSKFGFENAIEASIDRENGSIKIHKVLEIVETVEDPDKQITLKDALSIDKKKVIKVDDEIKLLNYFAHRKRDLTNAKIFAITGSAGKTSLKNLIKSSDKFGFS